LKTHKNIIGDFHIMKNMQESILKRFGYFAFHKLLGTLYDKVEEKPQKGFHENHALLLEVDFVLAKIP